MRENIVVVGGYGHVGKTICGILGERFPGKVYAAGRSLDRAERFSRSTGGKVKALRLDIRERPGRELDGVKLVVMCLDQTDTDFVLFCLERGIHYVDISAAYDFLSRVERLHDRALAGRATAVLSVGLVPGLTHLLARRACERMRETGAEAETMDIFVMLGLGDRHGKAAIEWTLDNLGARYEVEEYGKRKEVTSFREGKRTDFGAVAGPKKAYRFHFSDQHVLPRTLRIPSVSTRLCFDSAAVTRLLAWINAAGMVRVWTWPPVRAAAVRMLGLPWRFGSDSFAVRVEAVGCRNGEPVRVECQVSGRREADITAKVAAATAAAVYTSAYPRGVFHIEQLFALQDVLPHVEDALSVELRMNGSRVLF